MVDGDRVSSFAGRRRQVRGRWGAGCLKSLAPEEHFSRFPAAPLRGRAVPCAARCGAAAMRSSFRLFVPPNGLFLFFRITHGLSAQGSGERCTFGSVRHKKGDILLECVIWGSGKLQCEAFIGPRR